MSTIANAKVAHNYNCYNGYFFGCLHISNSMKNNVEVTFISKNGLILLVGDKEYYLSYGKFPWFKTASVSDVFDVQMKGRNRIRWEALDVDLNLSIITNPDAYPLIAK